MSQVSPSPGPGAVSAVRIALLYPNLLGTYGDAGNAIVLRARAAHRGYAAEVIVVEPGEAVPAQADVYLLGGGEDAKQTAAAQMLAEDGAVGTAVARGAAVLGICAGYQLLGQTFLGVGGRVSAGLGLLDVTTDRLTERAVGNLLARPTAEFATTLEPLIGFENHGGATVLGSAATPLGVVEIGVGNGAEPQARTEGAVQGSVFGTYLHGPALALNPTLADLILSRVTGPLGAVDDAVVDGLRRHRLDHVLPRSDRDARRRGLRDRLGRRRSGASGASATLSRAAAPSD